MKKEDLNQQYSSLCMQLGDLTIKAEKIDNAIKLVRSKIAELEAKNSQLAKEQADEQPSHSNLQPDESSTQKELDHGA